MFLIFRIIFGRTCYGTTVATFLLRCRFVRLAALPPQRFKKKELWGSKAGQQTGLMRSCAGRRVEKVSRPASCGQVKLNLWSEKGN